MLFGRVITAFRGVIGFIIIVITRGINEGIVSTHELRELMLEGFNFFKEVFMFL